MSEEQFQNNEAAEEGAPTWIVTFADLMSLLLCFFVLLLSFSEMDRKKYREVAGSMANAFGVQRKEKVFESPKGTRVIARAFDREKLATRDKEEIGKAKAKEEMAKKEEMVKKMDEAITAKAPDLKDMIEIEAGKHQMVIRLMGETAFDSGNARVKRETLPLLKKIAAILKGTSGEIVIAGHTDNVPVSGGKFRSNLQLSIERATRVTELLLAQEPIAPERISAVGFGKFRPLESNDTAEGRKRNRRVEIIIKDATPPE
jgi:chemotaxis protein MotB